MRSVFLASLVVAVFYMGFVPGSAEPIHAAGPFIEYQEVPVYVNGVGYCTLRRTYASDGDTTFLIDEVLIC